MDEFGLATATLDDLAQVLLWLLHKLVDALLICEDTVLLGVLKDTEVRFARHEEAVMLNDVNEAEPKEVQWDVHEVGRAVGHEADDVSVVPDDLRLHVGCDVLLDLAHALRLLHVKGLALKDDLLWKLVRH